MRDCWFFSFFNVFIWCLALDLEAQGRNLCFWVPTRGSLLQLWDFIGRGLLFTVLHILLLYRYLLHFSWELSLLHILET